MGYDQQRCDGIAHNLDCDAAWVYALPPEALEDGNVDALARQVAAIDGALFFGHSCLDQVTPHDLERVLRVAGRPRVERILLDGEAEEGNQQTTLTLWGMSMRLKGAAEPQAISNEAVYEKHQSTGRASHVEKGHGASLVMGPMLTERQLEEMWRIYLDRFLWLGALHPVSMEDPEEDWRRLA